MQKDLLQDKYVLKLSKVNDKERILKAAKKKMNGNLQRNPHKAITRFVSKNHTVQEWNDIIKILKIKAATQQCSI